METKPFDYPNSSVMGEQRVSRSYNLDNQNFVVLLNFIKTIYRLIKNVSITYRIRLGYLKLSNLTSIKEDIFC